MIATNQQEEGEEFVEEIVGLSLSKHRCNNVFTFFYSSQVFTFLTFFLFSQRFLLINILLMKNVAQIACEF